MADQVFDTHVHIYDRALYPFQPGFTQPEEQLADTALLIATMDAAGVNAALLVQTPWLGEDNRYLVEAMRDHPGRFAAIGYLNDPLAADAPERLTRQYHEDRFRGVRIHLADDLRGFADNPRVIQGLLDGKGDPLLRQARDLGVPVQFLNRVTNQQAIVAVADRFPDLTVVVDHLGHPLVAEAPEFVSSRHVFALAERPNIYVKVSNHVLSSRAPWPWRDLHEYQARLLDLYGARRLMWGSNWPMHTPDLGYTERLTAVRDHLPRLSADERAWVLGRTALSIWQPV
jgi:L-fuconolactonase